MPRDTAGNYTLPAGNPVVPGAVIETTWANPTMADLGQALQDSLSRSGLGGMLVPFQNADGTTAAPGITFTNELGTGFFRFGTGDMRITIQGTSLVRYRNDSTSPAGERVPLQIWDGLAWVDVGVASENFTPADQAKLAGIEALAEVNRTPAEVKVAYESNADTNAFTDAEETKLGGIAAGATVDQTPAEVKVAYESNANTNAFTDADVTTLAGVGSPVSGFMTTTAVPSTAVAVTGVGFQPSLINFQMTVGTTWEASSFGYYDGTVSQCVYRRNDGTSPFSGALAKIWFGANNAVTLEASAVGTSMDADGFTFTTSSLTDTAANVIWTAYP